MMYDCDTIDKFPHMCYHVDIGESENWELYNWMTANLHESDYMFGLGNGWRNVMIHFVREDDLVAFKIRFGI